MILIKYFLKHIIMLSGLKMKNCLIKKNLLIYHRCHQKGDEVTEGKELKILTPSKLLTRLPMLLAQIKAGKNEIRQILNLLHQHIKTTKKAFNNLIKSL